MSERDISTVPAVDADASVDLPLRIGRFEVVGWLGHGGMGVVFDGRDSVLDRRVALKLIHPSRVGGQAAARLLREAQALAKLAHPNVVTVFEVGTAGADPFIAMELIEGVTLLDWMREPRAWRAVLDLFIAVGHGLDAVHTLGLVHRDFKPSNVLIDARGVPKLGDFGVVTAIDEPSREAAPSDGALTETGGVMGTPAYMAPEQRAGGAVDARADQYAFAKSLREALREVPPGLVPILARAMAIEPVDRFATMAALLDELARVRRGNRWRWIAAGTAIAVVGLAVAAWTFGRAQRADAEDPCAPPTARVGAVWSQSRRGALGAHLVAIDEDHGRQRFAAASSLIDRAATRWMDLHVDACQVSHEGRQSDALLDRRMACLDRALLELGDTVGVLERATDRVMLDDAMRAVVGLPTQDACADVAALTEKLPLPTNPRQRAEVEALARATVDLDVALRAGGTRTGVVERARAVVEGARKLGHPETLAHALRSLGAAQVENEAPGAIATLREAITAAAAAHDDRLAAELWSKLLLALVIDKRGHDAEQLVPAAEAALARTASALDLEVALLDSKARVAAANSDPLHAQSLLDEARTRLEAAGANTAGSPLGPKLVAIRMQTAVTHAVAEHWERAANEMREVIPLANIQYGFDHPIVMQMHFNLGVMLRHTRDNPGALAAFREAARIGEARLAPSPNLAGILLGVGSTLGEMEKPTEGLAYLERALVMARATMPADDLRLAGQLGAYGGTLLLLKRYDEARAVFEDQSAIYQRTGRKTDKNWANTLYNLAKVDYDTKHDDAAIRRLEDALAIYEAVGEKDHYDIDGTLNMIADCHVRMQRWALALKTLDRIAPGEDPQLRAITRFARGRALAGLGNPQGVAEARAARAEMTKLGVDPQVIGEADAWLRHR